MKMIASAKLHRASAAVVAALPYAEKMNALLRSFLRTEEEVSSPFLRSGEVRKVAILIFSSNSSLCGAFNSNVYKQLKHLAKSKYATLPKEQIHVYAFGKKIAQMAQKDGFNIVANYEELAEKPDYEQVAQIAQQLMLLFQHKEIDAVELIYHHFKSTASQTLLQKSLLPLNLEIIEANTQSSTVTHQPNHIIEPSHAEILATLLPKVIILDLYTALLDSIASEHAARMLAMQIATDNAEDLLQELHLQYNKSRQQTITAELLDIIGGSVR